MEKHIVKASFQFDDIGIAWQEIQQWLQEHGMEVDEDAESRLLKLFVPGEIKLFWQYLKQRNIRTCVAIIYDCYFY